MRKIGYGLGVLLVMLLVALGVWRYGAMALPDFLTGSANPDKLALVPQSSISVAYLADDERWLNFPITSGTMQLKLISNASSGDFEQARQQRLADPGKRWRYALEIEVADGSGRTLLRRTHHHRADVGEYRGADGRTYTPSFYLREALVPFTGAVVNLDLAGLPPASMLRVRLARKDDEIADVALRVYQPDRTSEQRVAILWQRLSERQKEALARGSVYPPELLIEQERRNLLLHAWKAVGPKGAEGRDYRARELYVLLENDGEIVDDPVPPFGVLADRRVRATLPIPEGGGNLRLLLQPTPRTGDQGPAPATARVALRWHGVSQFARSERSIPLAAAEAGYSMAVAGGLLEVEAPVETAVRAFLQRPGQAAASEEEITPLPQYLRAFVADQSAPVSYTFEARRESSLFRLELRQLRMAAADQDNLVRYAIVDGNGVSLKEGEISLRLADSRYERVIGDFSGAWLSDPGVYYFVLPAQAKQIRLWPGRSGRGESPPLLVSAHSRPFKLSREIRVPEDFFDYNAAGRRIPAWFPLRPEHFEESVLNNRSRVILIQARPAEEKPEILAGRYQWEDYRPLGDWLARPIYTLREPGAPVREDSLPGTFRPLPDGQGVDLDFPAYQGMTAVTPTLVWIGRKEAVTLAIEIDGEPPLVVRTAGPHGEISLPPLAVGRHRLKVRSTSQGRLYVNHVRPTASALVRRLAQRFSGSLAFEYERTANVEETLTVRLFQPVPAGRGRTLTVRVAGPALPELTPLDGWIFNDRVVTVRPDSGFKAPVFGSGGEESDGGQPIYLPFTADAPKGKYRIVVQSRDGAAGHLTVSRLGPPIAAQRRVHVQPEIRRAEFLE